jgi:hypothetical protein
MPSWAIRPEFRECRVASVEVKRVQKMAEDDARAAGILYIPGHGDITINEMRCDPGYSNYLNCRMGFEILWDARNKPGRRWEDNPFVTVEHIER